MPLYLTPHYTTFSTCSPTPKTSKPRPLAARDWGAPRGGVLRPALPGPLPGVRCGGEGHLARGSGHGEFRDAAGGARGGADPDVQAGGVDHEDRAPQEPRAVHRGLFTLAAAVHRHGANGRGQVGLASPITCLRVDVLLCFTVVPDQEIAVLNMGQFTRGEACLHWLMHSCTG